MRAGWLLGIALWPGIATADEVFVRGGGQLTGEVVERGADSILVDIGIGRIGLPLSSVERIVPGPTPVGLYRGRAAILEPDDVEGWLALGRWADEHGLETHARESFQRVLAADPDNASAHRALGHVPVEDQWLSREESYRARGYVPFEGRWVTPDERRAALEDRRAATEARQVEMEAEARIREAEARARAAEADARKAEVDLRRTEAEAAGPSGTNGGVYGSYFAPFPYSSPYSLPFFYSAPYGYSSFAYSSPFAFSYNPYGGYSYPGFRRGFYPAFPAGRPMVTPHGIPGGRFPTMITPPLLRRR
jgi:hypothetical protein